MQQGKYKEALYRILDSRRLDVAKEHAADVLGENVEEFLEDEIEFMDEDDIEDINYEYFGEREF